MLQLILVSIFQLIVQLALFMMQNKINAYQLVAIQDIIGTIKLKLVNHNVYLEHIMIVLVMVVYQLFLHVYHQDLKM